MLAFQVLPSLNIVFIIKLLLERIQDKSNGFLTACFRDSQSARCLQLITDLTAIPIKQTDSSFLSLENECRVEQRNTCQPESRCFCTSVLHTYYTTHKLLAQIFYFSKSKKPRPHENTKRNLKSYPQSTQENYIYVLFYSFQIQCLNFQTY